MTKTEGLWLLKDAPRDDKPSALAPLMTRKQATEMMEKVCNNPRGGEVLNRLFELRVWQVVKDQKRPRFTPTSPKPDKPWVCPIVGKKRR